MNLAELSLGAGIFLSTLVYVGGQVVLGTLKYFTRAMEANAMRDAVRAFPNLRDREATIPGEEAS